MQKYIIYSVSLALLIFISSCSGTMPDNLGLVKGKFIDCPESPNCVSTQTTKEEAKMSPLSFNGSLEEAKQKLTQVINEYPRTKIIKQTDTYMHVEFKTKIMRFVDDVEFYFDESSKKIHFRSASRIGRSDFGLNRKRMEEVTAAF